MAQTLTLHNFSSNNILAKTKLTQDYAAGVTTLGVNNSADFGAGVLTLIGTPGNGNCEIIAGTTLLNASNIPLGAPTTLLHNHLEDVTAIFGNQLRIYRAADVGNTGTQPPDSSFTVLALITIDPSQTLTNYTDPAGSGSYWYKYTFYNPLSVSETALADSRAVRGDTGNNYTTLDAIKGEAGFARNVNITNDIIQIYRQDAQTRIQSNLSGIYVFPLPQPTNPIIERIARLMAAGELMKRQYRLSSPELVKVGEDKILDAEADLIALQTKTMALNDAQFNDTTVAGANGFSSWPDNTTDQINPNNQSGYSLQHFTPDDQY
jgi:hypothetical protein